MEAIGGVEDVADKGGIGIGTVLVAVATLVLCVAAATAAPESSSLTETPGPTLDPPEPCRSWALPFDGLVASPRTPSLVRLA